MSTMTAVQRPVGIQQCHPALMILVLVLTDVLTLAACGLIGSLPNWSPQGVHGLVNYADLIPFIFLFVLVFSALGLYSGVSASPPEELRKSTFACILISLCVAVSTVSIRPSHVLFNWKMVGAILLSIVAVPLAREIVRLNYCRAPWWGYPTVILGDEESCKRVIRTLNKQMDLALKPVGLICSHPAESSHVHGVPVIDENDLSRLEPYLKGKGYAVLTGAAESRDLLMSAIAGNRKAFPHVLIVPEIWEFSCFSVSPKNLGGFLGLEIREHLFHPGKQFLKRALDLLLTSIVLIFATPLLLLIALAIKIDSLGPVFYGQLRIGRRGIEFRAWKFRSMVPDADKLLAQYLLKHPALAAEWELNHKLRFDPRMTRVGRFLRQTSLDEIPQLWNVMRGEMSLVGPRPIVRDEIPRYGKRFDLYTSVQSGLTGLWQVSGRSETTYAERVTFDTFYIRNWSVWLDLYILFRTIGVLCVRKGAY
ncbi:MAG TPA: undecaprenyl-phosphate galactose phosphotransferase WbaP [Bryobacteraceae bacterium]